MPAHVYLSRRTFTGEVFPVGSSEGDAVTTLALGQQRRPCDALRRPRRRGSGVDGRLGHPWLVPVRSLHLHGTPVATMNTRANVPRALPAPEPQGISCRCVLTHFLRSAGSV